MPKHVVLDGDVIRVRVFEDGQLVDRVFVHDEDHPRELNIWVQLTYKEFVTKYPE